ncbi:MAG: endonuclease domain-containing protein [Gallionella sp.]|nr:endonuclease domain-containing protein [Gallionella sp.]
MKAQTNSTIIGRRLQRTLRNQMTDAEMRLWQRLRSRQLAICKFRRQHPYLDYVLDFVCLEKCLIVEVDGGQHLENERDQVRDWRLQEAGFRVLRFWNNQVLQETDAVVEAIWIALQNEAEIPHPHPNPPLEGEGDCALVPR